MAIVLTVSAWFVYLFLTIVEQFVEGHAAGARQTIEAIVYILVVTALTASAIAYLITRIGFFYRSRAHQRAPRAALDHFYGGSVPKVTVLVPSYQEDERVIRTTLLSAALQEHPDLNIVLLVDDPPNPNKKSAQWLLEAARSLPAQIEAELSVPHAAAERAMATFEADFDGKEAASAGDMRTLAGHYEFAADWLNQLADKHVIIDHADTFFVNHMLGSLSADLDTIAAALQSGADQGAVLPADRLRELYRRLVATFKAELSSFERKRYVSSSHAPNKAMNLNSYIALMGGSYREITTPLGRALVGCEPDEADLTVPDPEYILTLDADSVLLPEYCARILYLLEQSGHAQVGVAQTPYSSYPGSTTRIERIAGATTDLQHIVHQGMTQYDATFWVGANAILRKKALDDIVEIDYEDNWEIRRYIQDRTVIEDTESTIDLGVHGWTLLNYPERLAYSATPPDFGSLCIQRERWANGGLLILSKLRAQSRARRARNERNRFGEVFLRVNYMASIFWASLCLLILLIYPFNAGLLKPVLPLIALPYFLMMASDLRYCGYKRLDVLRIYGFNLILLPVNLSGTFASALQLLTGEKSSFKRTPKVRNRTTARAVFIVAPILLIAWSLYWVVIDIRLGQWNHLFFAALNAALAMYAMVAFVGIRNSIVDLWVQLRDWLYDPVPVEKKGSSRRRRSDQDRNRRSPTVVNDWESVIHYGSNDSEAVSTSTPAAGVASIPSDTNTTRISSGIDSHTPHVQMEYPFFTVFQPVVDLESLEPVGYEALTRFADGQAPLDGIDAAYLGGRGLDLDMVLAEAAVESARLLPRGAWLALNITPALADRPDHLTLLVEKATCPLVFEVTDALDGSNPAARLLRDLPQASISMDYEGAGHDGPSRIEHIQPTFIKLQRETVADIDDDEATMVLVRNLVSLADQHDCTVVAEGIETDRELAALRAAGVRLGQGYLVGRPAPVDRMQVYSRGRR